MAYGRLEADFGVWGTIKKVSVVILVLAGVAATAAFYVPTINQAKSLQREIEDKRLALKKQQELHRKYSEEIQALRHDPEAVERAIRENLHLAKPDETIYRFESSSSGK